MQPIDSMLFPHPLSVFYLKSAGVLFLLSRWASRWAKMIASTQELEAPEFNPNFTSASHEGFWSPLRKSLTMNLLGYLPTFASLIDRRVISPPFEKSDKPVVTYISRQDTRRRLTEESHNGLVEALKELEREGVCEVQIPLMEKLGLRDQVRIAARSAVSWGPSFRCPLLVVSHLNRLLRAPLGFASDFLASLWYSRVADRYV